ncbi:MFS transporter [Siccirubricoccus deserti]|uniref:MFS transporter n=1 Tax=Siccirubricoccus deserti TaxID=2013562 RepID=A0A9X0R399_9PROT|nr:MFS transporter [Siccirubricoccus deserti]MBC4018664.1 MFS transporter [Siccirubricoccus deserti]GGC67673.1 MFS transporter [Siccirubricoccus deserti]
MPASSARRLTVVLCAAEVLTMLGFSTFAVLLAPLRDLWGLSNAQAGLIGGAFFAGYTIAVPVLVSLTDRVDPRRIWVASALLAATGNAGFAMLADGLATALLFHALAGAGLAGTYMPGLRLLADSLEGRAQSRAVALYTASFGVGTASSYLLADWILRAATWRLAFGVPAIATLLATALVLLWVRPEPPRIRPPTRLLDFRPVLRNRHSVTWSLAYFAHSWELYAVRSWLIAFLASAAAASQVPGSGWPAPAQVAFGASVLGIFPIVLGGECSIQLGRKRTVLVLMSLSAATGAALGVLGGSSYALAVALALLHGPLMTSESASVTAGALGNADPAYRGATMALHSMLGFAGGVVGPVAFGAVLDAAGGGSVPGAWSWAFAVLALVTLVGPLALLVIRPADLPGDGRDRTGRGPGPASRSGTPLGRRGAG